MQFQWASSAAAASGGFGSSSSGGAVVLQSPRSVPNSSSIMTRIQRDQQQGKPAKFITYSCPDPDPSNIAIIAEESLEEATSVASSRESRV